MTSTGQPGESGKAGKSGAGGAGGAGGTGGIPSGTGGAGGPGGMGGGGPDYARGRRRFRFLVMTSLLLSSFAVFLSSVLHVRAGAESDDRQDQECRIFESQHEVTVERLRTTYRYLTTLPLEEYGTNLTVAVLRGLADQETRARAVPVPSHCDKDGVGLAEPNPTIPPKRDFSALLKRP